MVILQYFLPVINYVILMHKFEHTMLSFREGCKQIKIGCSWWFMFLKHLPYLVASTLQPSADILDLRLPLWNNDKISSKWLLENQQARITKNGKIATNIKAEINFQWLGNCQCELWVSLGASTECCVSIVKHFPDVQSPAFLVKNGRGY